MCHLVHHLDELELGFQINHTAHVAEVVGAKRWKVVVVELLESALIVQLAMAYLFSKDVAKSI